MILVAFLMRLIKNMTKMILVAFLMRLIKHMTEMILVVFFNEKCPNLYFFHCKFFDPQKHGQKITLLRKPEWKSKCDRDPWPADNTKMILLLFLMRIIKNDTKMILLLFFMISAQTLIFSVAKFSLRKIKNICSNCEYAYYYTCNQNSYTESISQSQHA